VALSLWEQMRDILPILERWTGEGTAVALGSVIERIGSAPRDPGATLAVSSTGEVAGSVTGGADLLFAMKDNDAVRAYMEFLSTAEAQTIWVKQGGASSVNKAVDLSVYPNDVQRNAAKQLSQATFFRASPDDQMPTAMESAFWMGSLAYIQNPGQLDSILSTLESVAMSTYTS